MPQIAFDVFRGIDTRPGSYAKDSKALSIGTNVSIRSGGAIVSRPALVKEVDLSPHSVGLYARGGKLRCIVPGGQNVQATQPANVTYDPIGDGAAYPLDVIDKLTGAETFGVDLLYGAFAYVAIHRSDLNRIEHHWIKNPPTLMTDPVSTRVNLPFTPGPAILKLAEKIAAPSPLEGFVRYCSSVNGASDWMAPADAGFENVLGHVSGERDIVTLTYYRGSTLNPSGALLVVFFADAVQLWRFNTDPAHNSLAQCANGPGAILQGAVQNLLGDVIYLSRGGFRTLSTASTTGEANEEDVGSRIRSLTDTIDGTVPAHSIWSQQRSQFLCAIGTTVYVLTYIPSEGISEWTTWELPVVVEYFVELEGVLYARSANVLYRFDDAQSVDAGSTVPFAVVGRFRGMALGAPGRLKTLRWLNLRQTGPANWQAIVDGVGLRNRLLPACSPRGQRFDLSGEGRAIELAFTAQAPFRLDGMAIDYEAQLM